MSSTISNIKNFNTKTKCTDADSKCKKNKSLQEGVIVNNCIKDPQEYPSDLAVLMPESYKKVDDIKNDKEPNVSKGIFKSAIIPLILAPVLTLGVGAILSNCYLRSVKNKNDFHNVGRVITLNKDNLMVLYKLLQEPTPKSLYAAIGVIAVSAILYVLKNTIDGFKEFMINQNKANCKKHLEEALINIETRSFAGKNQINRNLILEIREKLNEINNKKGVNFEEEASFKGNEHKSNKNKTQESGLLDNSKFQLLLGICTLGLSCLFAGLLLKNINKAAKQVEEHSNKLADKIEENISTMSEEKLLSELKKTRMSLEKVKIIINKNTNIPKENKEKIFNQIKEEYNVFGEAPYQISGNPHKIQFSSLTTEITGFLYAFIVDPKKSTRDLCLTMFSFAGLAYVGEKSVDTVKDMQVEKARVDTEITLQDKLVDTELRNFMSKKRSYLNPLVEDYIIAVKQNPKNTENLKKRYNNVLEEVKNGPPFVYA